MKRLMIVLAASLAISPAFATNNPPNECGNHGNNCDNGGGNATANGGTANSGAAAIAGAAAGAISGSHSSVGDVTNVAAGGAGGSSIATGGVGLGGKGGDAQQKQSNVGINGQSLHSAVDASSRNANQSSAAGNTTVTNVGGDSTLVERNAPPVFLGAITPTSCGGSFNAGGSSRDGAGGFGFSWVGTECEIRQLGDRYQQMGQVDTACELYSSTKAFKKAAKRNPKLRNLDCTVKPAPAASVTPAQPVSFAEPRNPRG